MNYTSYTDFNELHQCLKTSDSIHFLKQTLTNKEVSLRGLEKKHRKPFSEYGSLAKFVLTVLGVPPLEHSVAAFSISAFVDLSLV